jgi:hypothetical protein
LNAIEYPDIAAIRKVFDSRCQILH